jgi:hypothetical protein
MMVSVWFCGKPAILCFNDRLMVKLEFYMLGWGFLIRKKVSAFPEGKEEICMFLEEAISIQ